MHVNIAPMNNNDVIAQAYLFFQHGQLEAAHAILQPLAQQPAADFNLLHLAGAVAAGLQLHEQAIALYRRALALTPGDLAVSYKLGRVLYDAGKRQDALSLYLQLIAAGVQHADVFHAAALLLQDFNRNEEALQTLEHALRLAPQNADAWHRHGVVLECLQRPGDALQSLQQAVVLAPAQTVYRFDLALLQYELHRNEEALASVDQVLAQEPDFGDGWVCRAATLGRLRRYEESITAARKALSLRAGYVDANVNLALTLLALGRFDEAWPLYESRWQGERADPQRHRGIARWPGVEVAAGKTVLLWAEQGLGDAIQFSRYAQQVAALGANVVLEVHAALKTLLQMLEIDSDSGKPTRIIVKAIGEDLPAVDYQLPLMSLPLMFGTGPDTIPSPQAYLRAGSHMQQRWAQLLEQDRDSNRPLRIGIVCSGNAGNHNDRRRSIPLQAFAPLLDIDNAEFFLLQPELRQRDAEWLQTMSALQWLGRELQAFDDTAALIANLDLVIGVDTAAAHLAGALGVPVWILLSHAADWRWLLERDDSPWYASARLFRQTTAGDWDAVMTRVRTELSVLKQATG
jgi:tetratricopeptide (TPR) repeat protein